MSIAPRARRYSARRALSSLGSTGQGNTYVGRRFASSIAYDMIRLETKEQQRRKTSVGESDRVPGA